MYLHEAEAQKLGLVGDARGEHRRRLIRPLAQQLKKWCVAVAPTLLPSEPLTTAVRYYLRHREAFFRFIDDANGPIDNSNVATMPSSTHARRATSVLPANNTLSLSLATFWNSRSVAGRSTSPCRPTSPGPSSAPVRTAMSSPFRSRR